MTSLIGDWWRELCYTVVCILSFRNGLEVVNQSAHIWRDTSFSIALQQLLAVNNSVSFYDVSQADIHA